MRAFRRSEVRRGDRGGPGFTRYQRAQLVALHSELGLDSSWMRLAPPSRYDAGELIRHLRARRSQRDEPQTPSTVVVACSVCGARAGELCRSRAGKPLTASHRKRGIAAGIHFSQLRAARGARNTQ